MPANLHIRSCILPGDRCLEIIQGDLLEERVDALVNAANRQLQHGGGVAGAIARRGGPVIQEESCAWVRQHGPLSPGQTAVTSGGSLPVKYIIHTVGPQWGEGDEDHKLAAALGGALRQASELGLLSLALPAVSTGIFGFPPARAAGITLASLKGYFDQDPPSSLQEIRLVLVDRTVLAAFLAVLESQDPASPSG